MMNIATYQEELLTKAKEAGFSETEVYYQKAELFRSSIFEGEIDHYETSEEAGLGFRGLYNGKMGYSYTEKLDEESVSYLIEQAKANAEVLDEDDGTDIFEGSSSYTTHSYVNEELEKIDIPTYIDFLKKVEKNILAYDPRIVTLDYCMFQSISQERQLANSKGLSLGDKSNGIGLHISAVVRDGEETKTGSVVKLSRDINVLDADKIAQEVAEEALSYLGEKSVPSGKYPFIMRKNASASLVAVFSEIFSAENTQKDQSQLKGKVGEVIASEAFTLIDDPFHPLAFGGAIFDGEGVATKKHSVIENGKLQLLFHNRKTAKVEGCETTGHAQKPSFKSTLGIAPHNLYVAPSEKSLEQLLQEVNNGVLITDLSGLHSGTNTISGDFSVAATGFYIEKGKISFPIKQMTIAGNFYDYMKNVKATASDLEFSFYGVGSPSLLVEGLSVTVD